MPTITPDIRERLSTLRWNDQVAWATVELVSAERLAVIREARAAGMTLAAIGAELGVSRQRVQQLLERRLQS